MTKYISRQKFILTISILHLCMMIKAQVIDFSHYPVYQGADLGLTYSTDHSSFRVYAPTAAKVELSLYRDPLLGEPYQRILMQRAEGGTWTTTIDHDLRGIYYTYRVSINAWIFVIAGLSALAIALITVSFQAIKAAMSNPVKALRSE